ncbi:hypothetical protein PanWU01x14_213620 [Parasponia andersonii]|uniref:Uncharacterized protein n=1 Tax=Parasponia andersonii TaxID=3476 RepID=A0A2P5BSL6_PARAD|nr:hypothetical protein PanWU01x14_213620 [Parasponia andersonii]
MQSSCLGEYPQGDHPRDSPKGAPLQGLFGKLHSCVKGWHPYLASNPLLSRRGVTRPIHLEVDDMIPKVEESLAAICEALIP